jgi:hypothetical protein
MGGGGGRANKARGVGMAEGLMGHWGREAEGVEGPKG